MSRSDLVLCLFICSGIQLQSCTWHPPNLHSQLVRNGHWAGAPCWDPKLGCPPRSLQPGHETPLPATLPFLEGVAYTKRFFVKAGQNYIMCPKKTQFMCREHFSLTPFQFISSFVTVTGSPFQVGQKYPLCYLCGSLLLVTTHTQEFFQDFSSF